MPRYRIALLLSCLTGASCGAPNPLASTSCTGDPDCKGGFCLSSPASSARFCSLSDATCSAGFRWAPSAGDNLAGKCFGGGSANDFGASVSDGGAMTAPDLASRPVVIKSIELGPSLFNSMWGDGAGAIYLGNYNFEFVISRDDAAQWSTPQPSSDIINGIWGVAKDVFAVGALSIRHSSDAGFNWTQQNNPLANNNLYAIWGSSMTDIYAVGGVTNGGAATILHSANAGASWQAQPVHVPAVALFGVYGTGPSDVYAVGQKGTIVHSTDHGQSWPSSPSGVTTTLRSIWGADSGDLFVVGGDQTPVDGGALAQTGVVLHSTDHGATWKTSFSGANELFAIWGSGPLDLYVVGAHSTILHSQDRGQTWSPIAYPVQAHFDAIWGTGPNHFFIVGADSQGGLVVEGQ